MRVNVKLMAAAAIVVLVGAVVWVLLPRGDASQPQSAGGTPESGGVPVEAVTVRVGEVVLDAEAVGTLLADESVILRPEITGRIDTIHFREGQYVERGATLVTLDARELAAQLAQSTAAANLARLNYERMKDLIGKRLVSQQAYDEAQARLAEAEARRQLDQARLDKATLRAPFAGILGVRRVSPGDYVAAGQDLVNLENIHPIKVDLRLPEVYAEQVRRGQPIRVRVDALAGRAFDGEIYVIDPRVDATTRTLLVRARIPNPRRELRPGMFAHVTVVLGRRDNAILVPEQALMPSGSDQFVFRVVDGKAQLTKVAIGHRRAGEVEIRSGLSSGDTVVTAGHQKIRDGAPVTVLPPTEKTAIHRAASAIRRT